MSLTNNLLKAKKYFNNNKSLIVYIDQALLGACRCIWKL